MEHLNIQRGFSLIEILFTIFLVTMAIIGLAIMTSTNTQTGDFSKALTSATTLARDKIEELKGGDYESLAAGSDTSGIFTRSWNVEMSASPSDYKKITVTVAWNWRVMPYKVELKTIRARD